MVIVDADVLLYAIDESMPRHPAAKRWIEAALNGNETIGFDWVALLAFLRLSTRSGIFPRPIDRCTALNVVEAWLSAGPAVVVHPTDRHVAVLRGLLEHAGTAPNLVNDAHLAALCIEHGARMCTYDRDFSRFSGLRTFAP